MNFNYAFYKIISLCCLMGVLCTVFGAQPAVENPPAMPPLRVLSVDDGGTRGIIPAVLAQAIEQKADRNIGCLFDIFVGSGSGSVLAAAAAMQPPQSLRANYSPEYVTSMARLIEFFEDKSSSIYSPGNCCWEESSSMFSSGGCCGRLFNLCSPHKYTSNALGNIYRFFDGPVTFSESLSPLYITALNLETNRAVLLDSRSALMIDSLLLRVCAISMADSKYFKSPDDQYIGCGMIAANPSELILWELKKKYPGRKIQLVSLGAGNTTRLTEARVKRRSLQDRYISGQINTAADNLSRLSEIDATNLTYHRLQVDLELAQMPLDRTDSDHIQVLRKTALRYIAQHQEKIDEIVQMVLPRSSEPFAYRDEREVPVVGTVVSSSLPYARIMK